MVTAAISGGALAVDVDHAAGEEIDLIIDTEVVDASTSTSKPAGHLRWALQTPPLFLVAVLLSCAVVYTIASGRGLQYFIGAGDASNSVDALDGEEKGLEAVLRAAATADKTVILTTTNAAWSANGSVLDLFLESFRAGENTSDLLRHLVVLSYDATAHRRCRSLHRHCYPLTTDGVDFAGEKNFMTEDYLSMMWRRIDFLRTVLELGFSFIFSDSDILWFRSPLPRFHRDGEFQIACDRYNGNADDLNNNVNGGFNYVRSSKRTVSFYKYWYAARAAHPGKHDQDVFNIIKRDAFVSGLGMKMKFLSTEFFGGLCQPSRDLDKVCTMHVNCCIGMSRKINDMKVMLSDWREYLALPPGPQRSQCRWKVPQQCSMKPLQP